MDKTCLRCGTALEKGSLRGRASPMSIPIVSELLFVRPGTPTSWNPVEAVRQGMAGEPTDEAFPVVAWRCPKCGLLELCAANG